jgi:Domain of unknown function (DUF4136)
MRRNLIVAIVMLALTGCTMVKARVSSFHNLPAQPSGLTFAGIPYQWQNGSLEFQTYANILATELQSKGFVVVPLDQAQFVVFLAYAIDSGRQVSYSYPIIGQTGVFSSYTSGTVQTYGNTGSYSGTTTYNPTYGVVGMGQGSRTEYTSGVHLDVLDKSALAAGQISKVYEGEVVSSGSTGQLPAVMPTLLKALFTDFPGKSGQSKTVTLRLQ